MATKTIYFVRFFSYLAVITFLPFYAVWLLSFKLLSVDTAAITVGLAIIMSRFSAVFFANFVKKFHKRDIILMALAGMMIAYIGIAVFSHYHIHWIILWGLVSILLGVTMAVISLSILSLVAFSYTGKRRIHGFSYANIATNLSVGVGPFLGGLLMHYSPHWLPILCMGFVCIAAVVALFLPVDEITNIKKTVWLQAFKVQSKSLLILLVISFLMMVGYAQFYDIFPLFSKAQFGMREIGFLFLLSGLTIAIAQMPLTHLMLKVSRFSALVIANLLFIFGVSLLLFALQGRLWVCICGVILVSLAEVIFLPICRTLCIEWGKGQIPEFALAKLSVAWGLGESIMAGVGISLVGHGYGVISYMVAIFALMLVIILLFSNRKLFAQAHLDHNVN